MPKCLALLACAVLWLPLKAQGSEVPIQASGKPLPTNGPYLSIGLGALKPEDVRKGSLETSFDLGPLTEAAVGYRFGDFRTDISYSYTKNTVDRVSAQIMGATRDLPSNGSMQTNSGFLNLYYDVPTRKRFRPYLGGGVGYSRVDYSINGSASVNDFTQTRSYGSSFNSLGYQGKIGVSYAASNTIDLFTEAVYRGFTMKMSPYQSIDSLGFQLGVRYRF